MKKNDAAWCVCIVGTVRSRSEDKDLEEAAVGDMYCYCVVLLTTGESNEESIFASFLC